MARTLGQLVAERLTLMGCDGLAHHYWLCACQIEGDTIEEPSGCPREALGECRPARLTMCRECDAVGGCDSDGLEDGYCLRPVESLPTTLDLIGEILAERHMDDIWSEEGCGCRFSRDFPDCDGCASIWSCSPVRTRIDFCDECSWAEDPDCDCDVEQLDRGCCRARVE